MSETNTNDQQEEILVDLIQFKDCLSLYSKMAISEHETIPPKEINAFFSSLNKQLGTIVDKYQQTL